MPVGDFRLFSFVSAKIEKSALQFIWKCRGLRVAKIIYLKIKTKFKNTYDLIL